MFDLCNTLRRKSKMDFLFVNESEGLLLKLINVTVENDSVEFSAECSASLQNVLQASFLTVILSPGLLKSVSTT